MQHTLSKAAQFEGPGLHTGTMARMVVRPAPADHGLWFRRIDRVAAGACYDALIPARWDTVVPSSLCTVVANRAGTKVSTVEHLMAALAGTGVHNAMIDIDAPEVPILDGSARSFVEGLLNAGLAPQDEPVRAIRVLSAVEVRQGAALARLDPAEMPEMDFRIEFDDPAIGRQTKSLSLENGAFVRELADSRTFCQMGDVGRMRAQGLVRGGTYLNAVVFDGDRVVSPGGLRHRDEPVRHKMLDAVGDLALAGGPVLGRYTGVRAGHALTNRLLRKLFATDEAWEWVFCGQPMGQKLPGVGVRAADLQHAW